MTEKKEELFEAAVIDKLIESIEAKQCYKSISIILSEEEWYTLNQISIITGLTKTIIFKMALNQLLREIISRKQKNKKNTFCKTEVTKNSKKIKARYCSSTMPALIHNTIVGYAKKNGLKAYEGYSKMVNEFLKLAANAKEPIRYQNVPPNSPKRSISLFIETIQGMKQLKQRDQVSEYLIIYNAALRFIEKYNLLPALNT